MDVLAEIVGNADPAYDAFNRRLVPGIGTSYGVRVPVLRRIAGSILADDWGSFLESERTCFEEDLLHGIVIAECTADMDTRMMHLRRFVPTIDNWAVCDITCGKWNLPEEEATVLWDYCEELLDSGEEFPMRFAAVMMMSNFLDDSHARAILEHMVTRYHPGYYYRMGAAWCISYCYAEYPAMTERCLFSGRMDEDVLRRSVRKIRESRRIDRESKDRLKERLEQTLSRSPRSS